MAASLDVIARLDCWLAFMFICGGCGGPAPPDLRLNNAAITDDVNAIYGLVAQGLDPDFVATTAEFHLKSTPLDVALESHRWKAAKALIDLGADGVPGRDDPAARIVKVVRSGNLDLLTHVVGRYGAKSEAGVSGTPVAVSAVDNPAMLEVLLKAGADPNEPVRISRETALFYAIRNRSVDSVRLLLKHGADPNRADRFGNFPLFEAIRAGSYELVEALVRGRADLSVRNGQGLTPLHAAAKSGSEKLIRLLISNGANREAADRKGRTAWDLWKASSSFRRDGSNGSGRILEPRGTKAKPKH